MSNPAQLLAQLLADQRQRWARGERVLVEEYRRQNPEFLADPERLLDLIYNEIVLREKAGMKPSLDEYLARFPELTEPLGLQFEVHGLIQEEGQGTCPTVAGYELLEEIGHGGMGLVYKAQRQSDGAGSAVKVVRPELAGRRDVRKRFLTEAAAVAALDHPNIVRVYEAGECAAGLFLAMELVEGPSLETALRQGPLPTRKAVPLLIAVSEGVHHAHERGVIHRDLKPANILLGATPKVSDFGLAKVLRTAGGPRQSSTQQGMLLGTPTYMPPEQMGDTNAQPGPWNDVYSLGGILFAALTGRPPFDEPTFLATLLRARFATEPPTMRAHRPDVPEPLEQICRRCMSRLPADRFPTARALAEALRRAESSLDSTAAPAAPGRVWLIPYGGEPLRLEKAVTMIGRALDCDLRPATPEVSRRHCRIVCHADRVTVEDLNSQHGTRVNGELVQQARLRDGDRLELASEGYHVRISAEAD
ncbi:MAG: protein kinase domain-containing protein [Gemmataceae bacterium]